MVSSIRSTALSRSITRDIRIISSITILSSALLLGGTWALSDYVKLRKSSQAMHDRLLSEHKTELAERVERAVEYINFFQGKAELRLKETIKARTYEACSIAKNLITQYRGRLKPEALQGLIRESLRPIRYNSGRGYFFAVNSDGTEELFADKPDLEGKNLTSRQDSTGQFVVKDMLELARTSGEDFYTYTWTKPGNTRTDNVKIAFVKYLPELDWIIGTGDYLEDVQKDIQQEVLNSLEAVYRDAEGRSYLFAATWDGLSLTHPAKGKNMLEVQDANGLFIVKELIKLAQKGGGFLEYVMPKLASERPSPKLSYVAGIPEWRWYIGTGEYIDSIDTALNVLRDNFYTELYAHFKNITLVTLAVLLLNLLIIRAFASKLQLQTRRFVEFFHQAAETPISIDTGSLYHRDFRSIGSAANSMLQERNDALKELKHSEMRFKALHEASFGGVIIHDNGLILDCNQGLVDMTGYGNQELIGMDGLKLIAPGSLETVLQHIKEGYEERYEVEGMRKDGSTYPLSIKGKNVTYLGRNVRVIEFQDITVYKRAERTLRDSEERLRQIFETIPEPLLIARMDNETILDVNEAFERWSGISRDRAIGKTSLELGLWADPEQRSAFLKRIMADHIVNNFEADFVVQQGQTRTGLLSARLLDIDNNNEHSRLSIIRDITTEKSAERTLLQMDKMKSEFISSAAHELSTPLSAMMGYTEFLLFPEKFGDFPADQQKDFLNEIYDRGEALNQIIEDLLDISRIEQGMPITLDLQQTKLDDVLRKSIAHFKTRNPKHDYRLILPETDTATTLSIDRHRIRQVFENLLSNATKYTPEGKKILVELRSQQQNWIITVEDQGIGMTAEQLERVFDKFFRADASNTAVGGLGLGMSIARQIIEVHGGSIVLKSSPGEGTKAIVTLPLHHA
ncbi:MAG: hypothetical protein C0624_09125 [Desulfuromonas sp.]|nr:MAG: hypothetical protein C0624_09125 [Desulfuromonas sp.]